MIKQSALFVCPHSLSQEFFYCMDCEGQGMNVFPSEEPRLIFPSSRSNQNKRNQIQVRRRIDGSIKQFTNRYNEGVPTGNEGEMRKKMMEIKLAEPNTKGLRECAAVVVYFALESKIRLSLREYCKQNSLKVRLFNRKVNLYHKLFRTDFQTNFEKQEIYEQLGTIKIEQRVQQIKCTEKVNEIQKKVQSQKIKKVELFPNIKYESNKIKQLRNIVENSFYLIFKGFYFKTRKQKIISKIVSRLSKVDYNLLQSNGFLPSDQVTIYYIIYAMLKSLGFKISFSAYSKKIQKNIGPQLCKKRVEKMIKLYEGWQKMGDDVKSGSESDNDSDRDDRIIIGERSIKQQQNQSIELFQVQSGPLVLQEEFCSLQYFYNFLNDAKFG